MHTTNLHRLVLAAGLVDAILETNARMKLKCPLLVGKEGCLKCTRAAIWNILPEDCTDMVDIRGLLGTIYRRADAGLDEMDARVPVFDTDE